MKRLHALTLGAFAFTVCASLFAVLWPSPPSTLIRVAQNDPDAPPGGGGGSFPGSGSSSGDGGGSSPDTHGTAERELTLQEKRAVKKAAGG